MSIFNKKSVGVDISDSSIKIVELQKNISGIEVISKNKISLAPGIVENGRIKDEMKLKESFELSLATAKPLKIEAENIIFGLQDSQSYIHSFEIDPSKVSDKDELISSEVKSGIPVNYASLVYSFSVSKEKKLPSDMSEVKDRYVIFAAEKEVVYEWQNFFSRLNIEIEMFDSEVLAGERGIMPVKDMPFCLLDLGSNNSIISIFDANGLYDSYSINFGGTYLNRLLSESNNITIDEAENKKIQSVIGGDRQNDKIIDSLRNSMQGLLDEILKTANFYKKNTGSEISEIILIGGTSQLGGIVDYFKESLKSAIPKVEIRLGIALLKNSDIKMDHIEATGLALRKLDGQYDNEPFIESIVNKNGPKPEQYDKSIQPKEEGGSVLRWYFSNSKLTRIMLPLFIILVIVFGGLLYYKSIDSKNIGALKNADNSISVQSESIPFPYQKTLSFRMPIAVDNSKPGEEKIRGRVSVVAVTKAVNLEEAIRTSKSIADNSLVAGEKIWDEPVISPLPAKNLILPVKISWLYYSEKDAKDLAMVQIKKILGDRKYKLAEIKYLKITKSDLPSLYYLETEAYISTESPAGLKDSETENETTASSSKQNTTVAKPVQPKQAAKNEVTVNTTGSINVRSGPGKNFPVIDKIKQGKNYVLVEEKKGWFKIELANNKEGWIMSQYAAKVKN